MEDWYAHWFDEDYERLYAHRDQDEARGAVETALREAPSLALGPVLDLACGGGRHLLELRRFNPQAFGLDLSAHLLGTAPLGLRPWLLRGDMRWLPVRDGCLAGITLWFTPFGYFSDEDNRSLILALGRLLRPGGVLLLDYLNASHLSRTLESESVLERDGLRARVQRWIRGNRVEKRIRLERLDGGASREILESVRLYEPQELVALAEQAGLKFVRGLGDYHGTPFSPEASERWIALFQM